MTNLTARLAALREKGVELPEMWDRATLGIGLYPSELEALTVIERQREEIDAARLELKTQEGVARFWIDAVSGPSAIIARARLDLAEGRIAELEAQIEWWKGVLHRTNVEWKKDATKGRVQEERAEQAEADLAAERRRGTDREAQLVEVLQAEKDAHSITIQELAAERAKRCATCDCREGESFYCLVWSRSFPSDFGCSEYQPRTQAPNVAQQGSGRSRVRERPGAVVAELTAAREGMKRLRQCTAHPRTQAQNAALQGSERDAEGTGEVADGNA